jgi:hypothetical protein
MNFKFTRFTGFYWLAVMLITATIPCITDMHDWWILAWLVCVFVCGFCLALFYNWYVNYKGWDRR